MKILWIILLLSALALPGKAQTIVYHTPNDFITHNGDTIHAPSKLIVEKRSINRQLLKTGGDYHITSNRTMIRKGLRRKYFAVQVDSNLYVNCKNLKIKKFSFGKCYAPALAIGNKVYFCAVPIGPAAVSVVDRGIGMGAVGEAIATSAAVTQRVFYEIDCTTGIVEFVGKDKMMELLNDYPKLKEEYQKENSEEAHVVGKYLKELK
ncbi:DUF6563 family protein [Bacteroides sp. 519]|uniref:DUF6563 family protein n=1 Tax=Bacteroides sp. 519 TaxID=2302937 RepID=UPI0013D1DD51|nr:DUF6563 family protein [Bacteroides sp. 519]NDV57436.1 hypothetical protein [Bacteroides sp. 519]